MLRWMEGKRDGRMDALVLTVKKRRGPVQLNLLHAWAVWSFMLMLMADLIFAFWPKNVVVVVVCLLLKIPIYVHIPHKSSKFYSCRW